MDLFSHMAKSNNNLQKKNPISINLNRILNVVISKEWEGIYRTMMLK